MIPIETTSLSEIGWTPIGRSCVQWNESRSRPPKLPVSPYSGGFWGGGCARPGRANLRLIRRAIRERWDLPADKRQVLVEHLLGVVSVGHARNAIAAAWGLLDADRINLQLEREATG
jgi:hypothetical protein